MKRCLIPVLMMGLLAGCSLRLLPASSPSLPRRRVARRMEFANKEMQVRLQYFDWLLASHPQQRMQERQRWPFRPLPRGQPGHGQHPPVRIGGQPPGRAPIS